MESTVVYLYVGGAEKIRQGSNGFHINSRDDLAKFKVNGKIPDGALETFTFTLDAKETFRIAPRRSEHVNCSGAVPVLCAGEVTIDFDSPAPKIVEISNHSAGYCPRPESWVAVDRVLTRIGIPHPIAFTTALNFRRCPACKQINIVKDKWFYCGVCGGVLPAEWNVT